MICPICNVVDIHPGEMTCINCKMTGKEMEFWLLNPARNNLLGRIRELDNVLTAMLYPMGLAQWMLAIILKDGRLVTPLAMVSAGENVLVTAPAIPRVGDPWLVAITSPGEGLAGWQDGDPEMLDGEYDDDGLVEAIAGLTSG